MHAPGLTHWVDVLIVVLYFVFVIAVAVLSSARHGQQTVKGYFLAGRSMLWFPVGASLFSSNIGSEHFIGLAGSAAASGIATIAFEWSAAVILPIMGWIFLPIYLSSGLFTVPEYLSRRFGGSRLRVYLSILFLFSCVSSKISVDIYAGSLFIQHVLGWNIYTSMIVLLTVTAIYTIVGGLRAVIFTDTLQTIIMVLGSVILAILAFSKIGGLEVLMEKYMDAVADSIRYGSVNMTNITEYRNKNISSRCGFPRNDAWSIFRDPVNSDLPWPGLMIRALFVAMWYWCGDQVIIQRAISAKDIGHARGATIFASYLKLLPMFVITMPGMISRVLYPNEVACVGRDECLKICENPVGCSNIAYPRLVLDLAPIGLKGLMVSVMVSSMMSSLTSIFNSAATVFTFDLWPRFRKEASERESLIVGKVFVGILLLIGVCWIPLVAGYQEGQLFIYITAVNGYFAPPFCAVLLLAIFVHRVNEKGALYGMIIGHCIGLTRMILDFVYPATKCGELDNRPIIISKIHPLYFSSGHLLFSVILIMTISICSEKPSDIQIRGLTVWTAPSIQPPPDSEYSMTRSFVKKKWNVNIFKSMSTQDDETYLGSNGNNTDGGIELCNRTNKSNVETPAKCIKDNISCDDVERDSDNEYFQNIKGNQEMARQKLYIADWVKYTLNVNVVILLCVVTVLFCVFR